MLSGGQDNLDFEGPTILRSVAEDLKTPLFRILTQLESNRLTGKFDTSGAEVVADAALRLIDSYILSIQSYNDQQYLPLEPVAAQAIIYDCDMHLKKIAQLHGVTTNLNFQRGIGLVMANSRAFTAIITSLAYGFLYNAESTSQQSMEFTLNKSTSGIRVGLFSNDFDFSSSSLQKLRKLSGRTRQLSPDFAHGSSSGFLIADKLCSKMNVELKATSFNKKYGLSFNLVPSKQLTLI
jgi:hypothetical protein